MLSPKLNPSILFIPIALVLAWEPARWLVHTWTSPAYDSDGAYIFLLALGIFIWSASSPLLGTGKMGADPKAWKILVATASARAIGNLLAISVVGAVALAFDVYAFGRLAKLSERKRRVSPLFLALVFGFSLPIERIVQRVVGYGLQYASAMGSCGLLQLTHDKVICEGTKLTLDSVPVLVDLPCSGARGLTLILLFWAATCALRSPNLKQVVAGLGVTVVGALFSNIIRITALAIGIAHGPEFGVDAMAEPLHDIIGLIALSVGVLPIVAVSRTWHGVPRTSAEGRQPEGPPSKWVIGMTLAATVIALVFVPTKPLDVSKEVEPLFAPRVLLGQLGDTQPMSELETNYFQAYGGRASKTIYGNVTLLMVRTGSPLRHLHAPDECMRGAGYEVDRLGVEDGVLPSAIYRASSGQSELLVYVTYVGSNGVVASSISQAVFEWMREPNTVWTAYERAFPATMPPQERARFDQALINSLQRDH